MIIKAVRIIRLQAPWTDPPAFSLRFDRPRDIKGTAFLSFTHAVGADDQWLYLPALKRVKRISSNNKSGPFLGSEFAYEDFSSQEVAKYKYKYLRDEEYKDMPCFVLERYPVDKNSGYTRQIGWIDQAEYRLQKIESYDRKDELWKVIWHNKRWSEDKTLTGEFYPGWKGVEEPRDLLIVSDVIANVQTGTGNRIEFWDRKGTAFKSRGKIRRFIDVGRLTKGR